MQRLETPQFSVAFPNANYNGYNIIEMAKQSIKKKKLSYLTESDLKIQEIFQFIMFITDYHYREKVTDVTAKNFTSNFAMHLIIKYLNTQGVVLKDNLQLLAVTCVYIVSKMFDVKNKFTQEDIFKYCSNCFTKQELMRQESSIMHHFNYKIFGMRSESIVDILNLQLEIVKPFLPLISFDSFRKVAFTILDLLYQDPINKIFENEVNFICAGMGITVSTQRKGKHTITLRLEKLVDFKADVIVKMAYTILKNVMPEFFEKD